jgi:hypothetical protein
MNPFMAPRNKMALLGLPGPEPFYKSVKIKFDSLTKIT